MSEAIEVDRVVRAVLAVVLGSALRGTAVLVAASVLAWLLRRRAAVLRHSIWAAAVTTQLVLLIAVPVMPAWRVAPTLPAWSSLSGSLSQPMSSRTVNAPVTVGAAPHHDSSSAGAVRRVRPNVGLAVLVVVWFAGVVWRLTRLSIGTLAVRRELRLGVDVTDTPLIRHAREALPGPSRHSRRVLVVVGSQYSTPFTSGVIEPVVCLPSGARDWPEDRLQIVLRHELNHVERYDALHELVLQLALAVFWFNPALWLAARRLRIAREEACDDAVITAGVRPSAYVSELLAVLGTETRRFPDGLIAPAVAHPSTLARRLGAILDEGVDHGRGRPLTRLVLAVSVVILALPLAALRTGIASQPSGGLRKRVTTVQDGPCRDRPRPDRVARCLTTIDSLSPVDSHAVTVRGGTYDGVTFLGSTGTAIVIEARLSVLAPTEAEARELSHAIQVVAARDSIYATGPAAMSTHYWAIDYTIRLPRLHDVDARTMNGRVVVDGVSGTMRLASVNGPIMVRRAGGDIRGSSTNGPLRVDLSGTMWDGEGVFLESVSGPVDLHVPADFNAHLELGTLDGAVSTATGPASARLTRSKVLDAEIGRGGSTIHLQTMHGSLTVH